MLPGVFVQLVDGNGGIFGSQPVPDAGVILHDSQGPLHHLTGNQLAMKALCRNGAFVSCGNDNPKRFGPFQIDAPVGAVGRFQNQRFPAPPPGGGVTVFIFKSPFHCYQVGHFFILLHNQGHAAVVGGKTFIDQGEARFPAGFNQFFRYSHRLFRRGGDAGAHAPEQYGQHTYQNGTPGQRDNGGGMEKGGGGSAHEMLCVAEVQGSGSSWEPCSLMGGMNRARKVKAMTVRSSICPTPGMKSGIRSMGEKA